MKTPELLTKMQLDCISATQVVKDIAAMLNTSSFDDEYMEEFIAGGLYYFDRLLFYKLYKRVQKESECLTEDDYEMLFKNYGITREAINDIRTRLEDIKDIAYFDMKAVNGHFVIHPSEFSGEGCTGIHAFIMQSEGLGKAQAN